MATNFEKISKNCTNFSHVQKYINLRFTKVTLLGRSLAAPADGLAAKGRVKGLLCRPCPGIQKSKVGNTSHTDGSAIIIIIIIIERKDLGGVMSKRLQGHLTRLKTVPKRECDAK